MEVVEMVALAVPLEVEPAETVALVEQLVAPVVVALSVSLRHPAT
jgi:hypothetical protein